MDEILEILNQKISFIYELNNELFAIGHYTVLKLKDSNTVYPNLKTLFNIYKDNIDSTYEEVCKNNIASLILDISNNCSRELKLQDNKQYIISTEDFWNNLNGNERKNIEKQIDEFVDIFRIAEVNILYPGIKNN